ncbi:MAG: hypothetical protein CL802_13515 [Citromicrobium sp.]|nr:hypothetical protein [Citromicrobium sp.]|tara:strand:- start:25899 stop:27572 length:1674 start_codon:yes stop_codon:yes gene_type:complete
MNMWDAKDIKRDQADMEQARRGFDDMMRESAIWFLPRHQQFDAIHMPGGMRGPQNDVRIFDPHAQQAVEQSVSLFESYLMPRGQIWQRWGLPDPELEKLRHVREWKERKNLLLFKLRNDPRSGFTGQMHESSASLLVMGMQSMWPDIRRDVRGNPIGLSYRSEFVGQTYVKTDAQGLVSKVHYTFTWTAEKAQQKWGKESPECVKKAMKDNTPNSEFRFLHAIKPNAHFDPSRLDEVGKPWIGCFYSFTGEEIFKTGGYRSIPRIVSRYTTAPNEDYGRCPAFSVLPAVRGAQQLIRDMILASELNAMPPLGAHTDMMDETVKYAAHQITYGAIDHRGNRKIIPLVEPSDMSGSMAILERLQGLIDRAFFVDMLQIRQDLKSHVTDSQLYQREEEKGILLSPLANQETEWLSVMLDREIDLMDEMGLLDDMPGEVAEALEGGMDLLDVTYDNGLSRAQEAGAAAGYFRMLEQFAPVFQGDQTGEAWGKFTQKYPLDKVLDHMGRINGVPASWEADEDERAEAEAAALHRSKTQDLITALPAIGKSAKDLSQAVATDG